MADQIVVLLVGFVLTSVLGGLLGLFFQRRAWTHQFYVQRSAAEREAAFQALNEMSGLLDRRRYRMLLVYWHLDNEQGEDFERRVAAYRAILEDWNDGLNRRLAIVATYFGADLHRDLNQLYEQYRRGGLLLEGAVRAKRAGATLEPSARSSLVDLLEDLNERNYVFIERGLSLVLAGRVGQNAGSVDRDVSRPLPDVESNR